MLQACLYADRHAMECAPFSNSESQSVERSKLSFLSLSSLASFGRAVLRGRPSDPLSDHLLRDIGLTRADVDALSL